MNKEMYSNSVKSLDSLKDKAKLDETRVNVLEGLLIMSEAREANLKEALQTSQGTMRRLEA